METNMNECVWCGGSGCRECSYGRPMLKLMLLIGLVAVNASAVDCFNYGGPLTTCSDGSSISRLGNVTTVTPGWKPAPDFVAQPDSPSAPEVPVYIPQASDDDDQLAWYQREYPRVVRERDELRAELEKVEATLPVLRKLLIEKGIIKKP